MSFFDDFPTAFSVCHDWSQRVLFGGQSRGPAKNRVCLITFVLPAHTVATGLVLPSDGAGLIVHSIRCERVGESGQEMVLQSFPGEMLAQSYGFLRVAPDRILVALQRRKVSRVQWFFRKSRVPHLVQRIVSPGPSRRKPLFAALDAEKLSPLRAAFHHPIVLPGDPA